MASEDPRKEQALSDYRSKLLQHKELDARVRSRASCTCFAKHSTRAPRWRAIRSNAHLCDACCVQCATSLRN
eukprot:scaffold133_cov407-Prasinococcus_capsulatus_cf.AAC.24